MMNLIFSYENPRPRGLDAGGVMRRCRLGGVIVEPQLDSVSMSPLVLVFVFFFCLFFDMLCKRFFSPPCIGLTIAALFVKWGQSLF
jgi:hypothetical protein